MQIIQRDKLFILKKKFMNLTQFPRGLTPMEWSKEWIGLLFLVIKIFLD